MDLEGGGGERREERKGRVEGIRNRGKRSHSQNILHEKNNYFQKTISKNKKGKPRLCWRPKMLKAPES